MQINWKKIALILGASFSLAACGSQGGGQSASSGAADKPEEPKQEESQASGKEAGADELIQVISREEGSGTRDAFTEITKVKDGDTDSTVDTADIQNSTDAVMTTVAGDPQAVGYISLGSLNDTVKAVKVDGVEATEENITNDSYKLARPFNIVHKGELEGAVADFRDFIFSKEGQDIVAKEGYVAVDQDAKPFEGDKEASGQIQIAGSTSVGPLMEKLKEAYEEVNPEVQITITENGSGAGVQAAIDGTADLGMASRELKDDEKELTGEAIARDGIAVIVNKDNDKEEISLDDLKAIFTGEKTSWGELGE